MPAVANGVSSPTGEGKSPEPIDGGVDQRVLEARQIRLYIENTPDYVKFAIPVFVVALATVWPFVPDERVVFAWWGAFHLMTLVARFAAWVAFRRANPSDAAIRSWLKWFFVPQACGVSVISAAAILFLPSSSGHDVALTFAFAAFAAVVSLASSLQVAPYRPLIAPVITLTTLIPAIGFVRLPGTLYLLFALGCPLFGLFAYRLARKLNQAFVRSMELSIRNERLVAALEVRTAELQRQTLAAERAERDKTRFLAAASHDLRQPMHAISLLVGMLRPRASGGQEQDVVERLERSVEAMDRLFGTILDLSKLDAGAVQPSVAPVPLRAVFDSIELHFAPQAAARRLALTTFPSRAIVSTDRILIDRMLRNLVSNAIKYTNEGGVLVGCRRRGDDRLFVGVWDTGVGIAPEDRERIFEEYFQAGGGARNRSEGLGLGLAIVRRLARLLGSDVEVRSTPGRGSRLGLEVPLVGHLAVEEQQRDEESELVTALSGKLVLIVDDEPDVRFGAAALLERWGCRAAPAASVADVAAILERELRFPDAIVTDYRLGDGQTGLDVIATVRQYTGERTPAVIVTGEELGKAELEIAGRIYAVVRKPLSAEQLRRHLLAAVSRDAAAPALGERIGQ
jgi:signal transduction histidine kinase/CheY-like chemotaxis protein